VTVSSVLTIENVAHQLISNFLTKYTSFTLVYTSVLSRNRWRYNHHAKYVLNAEVSPVPIDNREYEKTFSKIDRSKSVISSRLGVEYTITIKRYDNVMP
jgi:hypothetical protein